MTSTKEMLLDPPTESEKAETPKPAKKSKAKYTLDDFARAAGNRLLDTPHVALLLGPHAASVANSAITINSKPAHPDLIREEYKVGVASHSGVSAKDLVVAVKELKTPFELSPVAVAMIECKAEDWIAAQPGEKFSPAEINRQLNIDNRVISAGFGGGHIEGEALLRWIERDKIKTQLSIGALGTIVKSRRIAKAVEEERQKAAETPPSFLDVAVAAKVELERQESEERERERQHYLRIYSAVLHRRNKPEQKDAAELAYVMSRLALDEKRLAADVAVLDRIDAWQEKRDSFPALEKELEAANNNVERLRGAVKELDQAERKLTSVQSRWREDRGANRAIEMLKTDNPDLFQAAK